jgi:hypothetical protein
VVVAVDNKEVVEVEQGVIELLTAILALQN